ncbi:MAG: response regulator transcription factor [Solirubrobacteraceae bacterium]
MLVADDYPSVRTLFGTLLLATPGVVSVLEAEDGAEAVQVGRERRVDVAVLDLNMPRLDGIEAARLLLKLQPSMRVALQSSDAHGLRARASGLGWPLFDKLEFDSLVEWVERQATRAGDDNGRARSRPFARKLELSCSLCGYGILSQKPPAHCPMCHALAAWTEPRPTRDAAAHEHVTG